MRLQKYMAEAGIASRRKCEALIEQGLVFVNGSPAAIGTVIDPEKDIVEYGGKQISLPQQEKLIIAFYKPQGVVSTMSDPQGRPCVADYFRDMQERLYPVGRLDFDSEGLLLMTNDGELAYRMMHPKFSVEKTYLVHCDGILRREERETLEKGVLLDNRMTSPAVVTKPQSIRYGHSSFFITIHEGRNRQVRRMVAAVGHKTLLLRRVKIGPIELGSLSQGKWRKLTNEEKNALEAVTMQ